MYVNPFWFGFLVGFLFAIGVIIALGCVVGGKK